MPLPKLPSKGEADPERDPTLLSPSTVLCTPVCSLGHRAWPRATFPGTPPLGVVGEARGMEEKRVCVEEEPRGQVAHAPRTHSGRRRLSPPCSSHDPVSLHCPPAAHLPDPELPQPVTCGSWTPQPLRYKMFASFASQRLNTVIIEN